MTLNRFEITQMEYLSFYIGKSELLYIFSIHKHNSLHENRQIISRNILIRAQQIRNK